jgi:putative transposase
MDGAHHMAAVRYVLMNPVRAKLCDKPEAWPWLSARSLLKGQVDALTDRKGLVVQFGDIRCLLGDMPDFSMMEEVFARLKALADPLVSGLFLRGSNASLTGR